MSLPSHKGSYNTLTKSDIAYCHIASFSDLAELYFDHTKTTICEGKSKYDTTSTAQRQLTTPISRMCWYQSFDIICCEEGCTRVARREKRTSKQCEDEKRTNNCKRQWHNGKDTERLPPHMQDRKTWCGPCGEAHRGVPPRLNVQATAVRPAHTPPPPYSPPGHLRPSIRPLCYSARTIPPGAIIVDINRLLGRVIGAGTYVGRPYYPNGE